MDIVDIGGLPAHPLLVHLPVVLVPLATVGALLMLLRPSWRRIYEIPTAVLAVLAAIATQLAIGSGESLEERVAESNLVETHAQIAEQARPFIFIFALVMVAVVVVDFVAHRGAASVAAVERPAEPSGDGGTTTITRPTTTTSSARTTLATVAVVLTALGLVFGVVSTVQVYRTGHSGAKATWHDTKPAESGGEGTSDGDGDGD